MRDRSGLQWDSSVLLLRRHAAFKRNNALIDSWDRPVINTGAHSPTVSRRAALSKGDHHATYILLSTVRREGRHTVHKTWTGSNRSQQKCPILRPSLPARIH